MTWNGLQRRRGAHRRRTAEKRNGLAVLMAGCSECGRIAPSPAEMHSEGWDIEAEGLGLVRITCPAHRPPAARAQGVTT